MKVQGKILSIVKTLYSKTQCFVYFNGSTSDKFDVLQGTGQGKILAAFMYKVYANGLIKIVADFEYSLSDWTTEAGKPNIC